MAADYERLFATHRARLWGLCYRMTGVAAEADDLVQETFRRALERPPAELERPWEPWLVTVATRLSIDALRRRQRKAYVGPWLPSLVATTEGGCELADSRDAEVRYGALETLSYGFLLALEKLSAVQRAVLLLRDAFGYSGPEVARMLHLSPDAVRTSLHRARKAMASAEGQQAGAGDDARAIAVLQRFMAAVVSRDEPGILACLAEEATLYSDGGGRYKAALLPIRGASAVMRFTMGVSPKAVLEGLALGHYNGAPALLLTLRDGPPRAAPRGVVKLELDEVGRIRALFFVVAPEKLARVQFPGSQESSSAAKGLREGSEIE